MKKVKVSKKGVRKIVAAVAALLAVVVLCYEIGNFNSSNVKTQPAAATTYRNSITVKMFAVRDESLINGSSSLTYVPLLQDGERVAGVEDLLAKGRVDFIFPADYRDGTLFDETMKNIVRKIAIADALAEENQQQLRSLGRSEVPQQVGLF